MTRVVLEKRHFFGWCFFKTLTVKIKDTIDNIQPYECKYSLMKHASVKSWYDRTVGLEDYSMSLNRIMHIQKWDFGWCVTSKLNKICVKFSKIKVKMFSNGLCQHLSIAIFHVKNGLIHNYCGFYKWEWLIYVLLRTKFIR